MRHLLSCRRPGGPDYLFLIRTGQFPVSLPIIPTRRSLPLIRTTFLTGAGWDSVRGIVSRSGGGEQGANAYMGARIDSVGLLARAC
jgi:hypothetical protein